MTQSRKHERPWAWATLLLWIPFLVIGLLSEETFETLRKTAGVDTYDALVNSPSAITVAFAVYLGLFALRACRAAKVPEPDAQVRALQVGIIAIIAFLPFPIEFILRAKEIPQQNLRYLVYCVVPAKILGWVYLLVLIVRCYGRGSWDVFARMRVFFPFHARDNPHHL